MAKEMKKIQRLTIEFVSNGFVVETYGFNPYGPDYQGKAIKPNATEVLQDFLAAVAHNERLDAEEKAKQAKEAE